MSEYKNNSGQPIAVARGGLTDTDLHAIFNQAAEVSGFAYLLWQTVESLELETFSPDLRPEDYLDASAFGPDGELRWRRETWYNKDGQPQNGWRVVFTGTESSCPDGMLSEDAHYLREELHYYGSREANVLMWGERRTDQPTWIELRIPRRLDYPWDYEDEPAPRLSMQVIQYFKDGRVAFSRSTSIKPWRGG